MPKKIGKGGVHFDRTVHENPAEARIFRRINHL